MTLLEILFIILGFVLVSLSFFIANNKENVSETRSNDAVWSEKEETIIRERMQHLLEENAHEIVESALSSMNRISNEKIMAVDEFSGQVLEKIEQNHKEVVFMYDMLNEKEKEYKKATTIQKEIRRPSALNSTNTDKQSGTNNVPQTSKATTTTNAKKIVNNPIAMEKVELNAARNKEIQDMHKKGMTILEISKALSMGQGEVKLVVDLYGGK